MRDDTHIRVGPVNRLRSPQEGPKPPNPDASFLYLKFQLEKPGLSDEEVRSFAKEIARACREAPMVVRGVDWHDLRPRKQSRDQFQGAVSKVLRTNTAVRRMSHALSDTVFEHQRRKRKHGQSDASLDERQHRRFSPSLSPTTSREDAKTTRGPHHAASGTGTSHGRLLPP